MVNPRKFLREVCDKVNSNSIQNITKASTESESSDGLVILPYIKGTTEQLKRVLYKHKFKVAMKTMFTLRSQLMRPKDALGELKQSGVAQWRSQPKMFGPASSAIRARFGGEGTGPRKILKLEHQKCHFLQSEHYLCEPVLYLVTVKVLGQRASPIL